MSPLRILILIGLFYLLFRLLIGAGKKEGHAGGAKPTDDPGGPPQDVLMEDPVCGTLIPARRAITLKNNGKIVYFCGEACRSKFITTQGDQP